MQFSGAQVTVRLTNLKFGFRSGVMRTDDEGDDIVSVSYGVEPVAMATFAVASDTLSEPFEFTLNVVLDRRGTEGAVGCAKAEAGRFLALLGAAEVDLDG